MEVIVESLVAVSLAVAVLVDVEVTVVRDVVVVERIEVVVVKDVVVVVVVAVVVAVDVPCVKVYCPVTVDGSLTSSVESVVLPLTAVKTKVPPPELGTPPV